MYSVFHVVQGVHGWRWALVFHVICYILCARVEVGYTECTGGVSFSVLCYMLYTVCTGGGGLY